MEHDEFSMDGGQGSRQSGRHGGGQGGWNGADMFKTKCIKPEMSEAVWCCLMCLLSFLLYLYFLVTGLYPSRISFSRKRQNVYFIYVFVFAFVGGGSLPSQDRLLPQEAKRPKKASSRSIHSKKLQRLDPFIRQIVFNGNCIGSAGSEYKSDQGLNIHYIHLYSSHFHLYRRLLRFTLKKCQ